MRLIVALTGGADTLPEKDKRRVVASAPTPGTLTIGRGSDNSWVLPDPDRTISRRHCTITFESGHFVLTDLSQSGVLFNGAREPHGPNSRIPLAEGDQFEINGYTFRVSLMDDGSLHDPLRTENDLPRPVPVSRASIGVTDPDDGLPPSRPLVSSLTHSYPDRRDPLRGDSSQPLLYPSARLGPGANGHAAPANTGPRGRAPATSEAMPPIRVRTGPRVNFDDMIGAMPFVPGSGPPPETPSTESDWVHAATSPVAASAEPPVVSPNPFGAGEAIRMPGTAPSPAAEPPALSRDAPDTTAGTAAGLAAFLEGAGISAGQLPNDDPEAILKAAGEVFRALTEGFHQVLRSRATVKRSMGIDPTHIAGDRNNALKFSVTTDEAVSRLLRVGDVPGYLPARQAARQAASDIAAHELAVMAGVQTALSSLFHRFDPDEVEKRLAPGLLGLVLPAAHKARCWDAFRQAFDDLSREAEDEFQTVFGRPFAKAYSSQTRED